MNKLLIISLTSVLYSTTAYADSLDKLRVESSKIVVKEFMGQLKNELQTAMKAGGPNNAINVCRDKAPVIAKNLSDKYGWTVARTSLKTRNVSNAADSWETTVLNKFEQRKIQGEDVKPMAYFEEVKTQEGNSFRFMKAIPTGQVCLACHGDKIDPKVATKLITTYPDDKAIGFKLGDIRGAFTITQPIN